MTLRSKLWIWYMLMLGSGLLVVCFGLFYEILIEGHPIYEGWRDIVKEVTIWTGVPALFLIFGGLVWLKMMRNSLEPLTRLTAAARSLTAGQQPVPVEPSGQKDELDELADAFNSMAARMNDSFARVRDFSLHASHELKTPLSILRNEMETALRVESLTIPQRDRILSQLEEIQRLARIVDSLAFLTTADSGLQRSEHHRVSFDGLVLEVFEDVSVLARERGLEVSIEGVDSYAVRGDRNKLRQMLLNLADNALKYCNPGGRIWFKLERMDARVRLSIINTGPGLPTDLQPHVFDRFFRGDSARSRKVDGCGLGLAIVRSVVELHEGEVRFHSIPDDRTTVTVELPLQHS